MDPKIEITSKGDELLFTLSGVGVSIANALRRTIISDIPTVVFKTAPYEENKCSIFVNTTRLNNEILKQRLSCIPIHIPNYDEIPLENYLLELNVTNDTDSTIFVTSEDFKIRNKETNTYLSETDTRNIFPPDNYTGRFIDFARLRPKLSEQLLGEQLHLTCEFSVSNAKDDAMFNVISTCSYGFTPDIVKIEDELQKKVQSWKDEGKSIEEINFESKNWKLLDALRITTKNSFDFIIESVGVYDNKDLVYKACNILLTKLQKMEDLNEQNEITIKKTMTTMENSFDIILENEDYTIGHLLEFVLLHKFYEGIQILSYCSFKKFHPHDNESIIRVAYKDVVDISSVKGHLKESIIDAKIVYDKIRSHFIERKRK